MLNGTGIGRVVPVLFIHDGCAVIGGSNTGSVRIWDADSAHFIHALEHGGASAVCDYTYTMLTGSSRSRHYFIC